MWWLCSFPFDWSHKSKSLKYSILWSFFCFFLQTYFWYLLLQHCTTVNRYMTVRIDEVTIIMSYACSWKSVAIVSWPQKVNKFTSPYFQTQQPRVHWRFSKLLEIFPPAALSTSAKFVASNGKVYKLLMLLLIRVSKTSSTPRGIFLWGVENQCYEGGGGGGGTQFYLPAATLPSFSFSSQVGRFGSISDKNLRRHIVLQIKQEINGTLRLPSGTQTWCT